MEFTGNPIHYTEACWKKIGVDNGQTPKFDGKPTTLASEFRVLVSYLAWSSNKNSE